MAENTAALTDYLRNIGVQMDSDSLRDGVILLTWLLMEAAVSERTGCCD